ACHRRSRERPPVPERCGTRRGAVRRRGALARARSSAHRWPMAVMARPGIRRRSARPPNGEPWRRPASRHRLDPRARGWSRAPLRTRPHRTRRAAGPRPLRRALLRAVLGRPPDRHRHGRDHLRYRCNPRLRAIRTGARDRQRGWRGSRRVVGCLSRGCARQRAGRPSSLDRGTRAEARRCRSCARRLGAPPAPRLLAWRGARCLRLRSRRARSARLGRHPWRGMKILYVSQYFPPEMGAPSARVYELSREWVRMGHDVSVLTGFPNHPVGIVFEGYRGEIMRRETVDGIRVVRIPIYAAANKAFFKRVLNYSSFWLSASMFGPFLTERPDVVVGTSPQFLTAVAALW